MSLLRVIPACLFFAAGLLCCCIGVLGVFRFRYAANRMHAAAINDSLGISLCMIGLAIAAPDAFTAAKFLLVVVFFWLTAPVASHLLCRLEIETNEQREAHMTVHAQTLQAERDAREAQAAKLDEESVPAVRAEELPEEEPEANAEEAEA